MPFIEKHFFLTCALDSSTTPRARARQQRFFRDRMAKETEEFIFVHRQNDIRLQRTTPTFGNLLCIFYDVNCIISDHRFTGTPRKWIQNSYLCSFVWKQSQHSSGVDLQFDNYRVKWLIYNAASPVAFAESTVASQDHNRKNGWNQE